MNLIVANSLLLFAGDCTKQKEETAPDTKFQANAARHHSAVGLICCVEATLPMCE
jgi:hypothetical protein